MLFRSYEGMLAHGYEGVRQIEAHLTNTMGWSATTGQVQPWVYQQLTRTFMLDPVMRDRLAQLNPAASAKVANRLLELGSVIPDKAGRSPQALAELVKREVARWTPILKGITAPPQ